MYNCGLRFTLSLKQDAAEDDYTYDVLVEIDQGDDHTTDGTTGSGNTPESALMDALRKSTHLIAGMMTDDELAAEYDL